MLWKRVIHRCSFFIPVRHTADSLARLSSAQNSTAPPASAAPSTSPAPQKRLPISDDEEPAISLLEVRKSGAGEQVKRKPHMSGDGEPAKKKKSTRQSTLTFEAHKESPMAQQGSASGEEASAAAGRGTPAVTDTSILDEVEASIRLAAPRFQVLLKSIGNIAPDFAYEMSGERERLVCLRVIIALLPGNRSNDEFLTAIESKLAAVDSSVIFMDVAKLTEEFSAKHALEHQAWSASAKASTYSLQTLPASWSHAYYHIY